MDLRSYDIPNNIDEILREQRSRHVMWYQPFIFSNTAIVGTGAAWNNSIGIRQYVCTDEDKQEVQKVFVEQNIILGNWYEELVNMVVEASPESMDYIDFGCNAGHFCFSLLEKNKRPAGVDVWEECYKSVSNIIGAEFEYIQERYDSATHKVPSLAGRNFDFGIASAIQTHLSDPHFFIAHVASLSKNGVLFTTPVVPYPEPIFRHRITMGRRNRPLPERFEFLPSESAMEIMLQCVYSHVYSRAVKSTDPRNTRSWGVWLCLNKELSADLAKKYGLSLVPDRSEQFADLVTESCSVPQLRLGRI